MPTATLDRSTEQAPAETTAPPGLRARRWLLTTLAVVCAADQATKAAAWRGLIPAPGGVSINPAGDVFTGPLGRLWLDPLLGGVLDILDTVLLVAASALLIRRVRSRLALASGALIIGGWSSNLSDRLGLHLITAPGSQRGAVDWLTGYNLADVALAVGGVCGLVLLTRWLARRFAPALRVRTMVALGIAGTMIVGLAGVGATVAHGGAASPVGVKLGEPIEVYGPLTELSPTDMLDIGGWEVQARLATRPGDAGAISADVVTFTPSGHGQLWRCDAVALRTTAGTAWAVQLQTCWDPNGSDEIPEAVASTTLVLQTTFSIGLLDYGYPAGSAWYWDAGHTIAVYGPDDGGSPSDVVATALGR